MLIFGGTTEGRRLARALSAMGHQVWVSVATPLGAEELAGLEDVSVLVGRRSGGEMDALLSRGFHRCVDATHPYAVQATREIGAACARAGVPLRRLLRPEGGEEGLRVDSPEEAARLLHLPIRVLRPDYQTYGRMAPLLRDNQIVQQADLVLAFWDGHSPGTAYTLNQCVQTQTPFRIIHL